MKHMDSDLNLERLLARSKELPPDEWFDLYYDPGTHYYYLNPDGVMLFWIPRAALYIGRGKGQSIPVVIERFISAAVTKLIKEEKV